LPDEGRSATCRKNCCPLHADPWLSLGTCKAIRQNLDPVTRQCLYYPNETKPSSLFAGWSSGRYNIQAMQAMDKQTHAERFRTAADARCKYVLESPSSTSSFQSRTTSVSPATSEFSKIEMFVSTHRIRIQWDNKTAPLAHQTYTDANRSAPPSCRQELRWMTKRDQPPYKKEERADL
jgi:hypothetical protein